MELIISWIGATARRNALKRVENKTHNLLGPENNRKRVEEGTHPFVGPEMQRRRVEDGTHNLLGKGLMTVYDKVEQRIISRIAKEEYHNNRDRYLTPNSNEYKKIKAASIEAQTQIENN